MKLIILYTTLFYVNQQGGELKEEFDKRYIEKDKPFTQKTTESGVVYLIREEI